jgi:hypothetical protein
MPPKQLTHEEAEYSDDARFVDAEADDITALAGDERAEEDQILSALASDVGEGQQTWQVRQIIDGQRELPYVTEGAGSFSMKKFVEDFVGQPGGKFQFVIRRGGRIRRKLQFEVAAQPIKRGSVAAPSAESPAVLAAINAQNQMLMRMIEKATQTPPPAPPPPRMTTQDIVAIGGLIVSALPVVKEMFGSKTDPILMLKTVMELAGDARELRSGGDGEGKETGVLDLVSNLANSPFAEALAKQIGQNPPPSVPQLPPPGAGGSAGAFLAPPRANPPAAPQIAAGGPQIGERRNDPAHGLIEFDGEVWRKVNGAQTPPQTGQAPNDPPNDQMAELKRTLDLLVRKAALNADVTLYADFLLDQDEFQPFLPALADPTALDQLCLIDARVGAYREWFAALLAELTNPEPIAQPLTNLYQAPPIATNFASPAFPNASPIVGDDGDMGNAETNETASQFG